MPWTQLLPMNAKTLRFFSGGEGAASMEASTFAAEPVLVASTAAAFVGLPALGAFATGLPLAGDAARSRLGEPPFAGVGKARAGGSFDGGIGLWDEAQSFCAHEAHFRQHDSLLNKARRRTCGVHCARRMLG